MEFFKSYLVQLKSGKKLIVGTVIDSLDSTISHFIFSARPVINIETKPDPLELAEFVSAIVELTRDHPSYDGSAVVKFTEVITDKNFAAVWTPDLAELAERQGWAILWYDSLSPEIQALDEIGAFTDDVSAQRFVWALAERGEELHQKAISALQVCFS